MIDGHPKIALTPEILDHLLAEAPKGILSIQSLSRKYNWSHIKPILKNSPNAIRQGDAILDRRQLPDKIEASIHFAQTTDGIVDTPSDVIPGLICKVKIGTSRAVKFYYAVFQDNRQILWKITPTLTAGKRFANYRLLHRNSYGSNGFHLQAQKWKTPKGYRDLLEIVALHRAYEDGFPDVKSGGTLRNPRKPLFTKKVFQALPDADFFFSKTITDVDLANHTTTIECQYIGSNDKHVHVYRTPAGIHFSYNFQSNRFNPHLVQ